MSKILLVEDAPAFQLMVKQILSDHQVSCAADVDQAISLLERDEFDLILLDISLPGKDGYSFLQEQQADPGKMGIPVICLTAHGSISEKATAFSLGADDFIVKPFHPAELKVRVEGRLNKSARLRAQTRLLVAGNFEIDRAAHRVTVVEGSHRREVEVTQTEFKLLCALAGKPDRVCTRTQLLLEVWGHDTAVLDRAVDVHLCSLRKKLGSAGARIRAVPGMGYKLSIPAGTSTAKSP